MANTTLFRSLIGALIPAATRTQRGGRPGLRAAARAGAGAVRRDRLPEHDVLRHRRGAARSRARPLRRASTPEFVAKTAVYCRERGHMKDMPALLLAVLSRRDPRADGRRLRSRDRLAADAADVRADRPLGRDRPQVARLGAEACVRRWLDQRTDAALFAASVGNAIRRSRTW